MDFGTLEVATLWRLTKDGVVRRAVVIEGERGPRLVIAESGQIVGWERFPLAGQLRKRAVELRKQLQKTGWVPVPPSD